MITRMVKVQLVVFTVLSLIAATLIFFNYARVPDTLGIGKAKITARFAEGAGIYPFANVTYRGATVGRVTDVRLAAGGVDVEMRVDRSAEVPRDVDASIHSVSAIGEQYVDLVPRSSGGPRMADGDRIARKHTRVPRQIAQVLDDVDTLLASVPRDSLSVVLDEARQGFEGLGPDLARLMDNTRALVKAAEQNYDATSKLIRDAEPVLDSQLTTSDAIRGWTSDLATFTDELRRGDSRVRAVLDSVPGAAGQVEGLLDDLSPDFPRLLASSDVLADLAAAYRLPIEQVMVVYPMVAAINIATNAPDRGGQFRLAFKTVANYPGGCWEGWPAAGEPRGPRPPHEVSDEEFPEDAYCQISQDDPRVVRGARNLQCFEPGSKPGRRAATIYQCRGSGYQVDTPPQRQVTVPNPAAEYGDDVLNLLSGSAEPGVPEKELTWQNVMLGPLGR